jgi:hypothetical protein
VPEACKEQTDKDGNKVAPSFAGSVELVLPTFDQKYEYLESTGIDIDDKGAVDLGTITKKMRMIRKLVALTKDHYKSVDLKCLKTNAEFKSFDDMTVDDACHSIMIEIAMTLLTGIKLGN